MEPYKLVGQLDPSKNSNENIALKFDAGKVKSEKYGEATLSGYFLFMHRHGEFPQVNVQQIEKKASGWLENVGLEEYQDILCEKINVPSIIAYSAPGTDPEVLALYFQITAVYFLLDDLLLKLSHLNSNDPLKNQEDVLKLVKSLISIVESNGDRNIAQVAASKHPMFKPVCLGLAYVCRHNFERESAYEYSLFAKETVDYFRTNKWQEEYRVSSYSKNDLLFIRSMNVGIYPLITQLCMAKGVYISNEIRTHPLLQKYYKNAILQLALCNDVLSLRKELADDEKENFVLVKCKKYSLQESIRKTVKVVNELMIDLKKDRIKLMSYFPDNLSLKDFIQTVEGLVDGYLYWYPYSKRYGVIKFQIYTVDYDCDYDNWLEKIGIIKAENMIEPVCKV